MKRGSRLYVFLPNGTKEEIVRPLQFDGASWLNLNFFSETFSVFFFFFLIEGAMSRSLGKPKGLFATMGFAAVRGYR